MRDDQTSPKESKLPLLRQIRTAFIKYVIKVVHSTHYTTTQNPLIINE